AMAMSQIGKHEDPLGSNSGPEVNEDLPAVKLRPGLAWCGVFGDWCYMRSAAVVSTQSPCFRSGSVLTLWDRTGHRLKSMVTRRGSLYFVDHGNHQGHMGFVVDATDGKVEEVSGNTNQDIPNRDGTHVWKHTFRLTDAKVHGGRLIGFVDFAALVG